VARAAARPSSAVAASPTRAVAAKASAVATPRAPRREVLLRLHGSNTIGSELAPRLAEAFLRRQGASAIHVDDSDHVNHRVFVLGEIGARPVAVEIYAPGSKVAFQSLAAGRCDIGMASRAIDGSEGERLRPLGDMSSPAAEHVIGLDGVAVIVNKNNPVAKLTVQQVASIFAGFIRDWSQVGGPPGRIQAYARDEKSGTFDTFVQGVMRGRKVEWQGMGAYESSDALADAVANDEHGIGFIGLPYVRNSRALALQDGSGSAMPLYPTVFTVSTEDYPLSRRLRLYTAVQPKNPMVARFLELTLSEEGQHIVADAGFIPLTVHAQAAKAPSEAPEKYVRATQGGQRLSVNFRFKKGSSQLDVKAMQDVDSLVRYLSGSETNRARKMMLFGFADKSGKETVNRHLSKQRAESVAEQLKEHGVVLDQVDGFGSALPLSPNDNPDGRERNRRVEVWVK
jgi:phosphate transport system substrate-binding protein